MLFKMSILISGGILLFIFTGFYSPSQKSTDHIPAVNAFDLNRYLGTWYEVARLPHFFEKHLDSVTASYSLREDGKIRVLNRGFHSTKKEWKEAEGKAYIPDPDRPSVLKVRFFWIFGSDYKIIALDSENYQYAMVTSSSKKYLWILSRTPQMEAEIYNRLVKMADAYGFDIEKLYQVPQPQNVKRIIKNPAGD